MTLLSIGAFAQRCRLPVSTLRFYHEVGILMPVEVDPTSNYRYYSAAQLPMATLIAELRAVGLTPKEMRGFLAAKEPASILSSARAHLSADIADRQRQLERLDRLIRDHEDTARIDPPILTTATLDWVISRTVTTSAERVVETVRRGLVKLRRDSGHNGRSAATFPLLLDTDGFEVDLHLEATQPTEPAETKLVLVTRHIGPYRSLWQAYEGLLDDAHEQGHRPAGQVTERYLSAHGGQPHTEVLLHILQR